MKKGFSLMEGIIYVGIAAVVLPAVFYYLTVSLQMNRISNRSLEVSRAGEKIMQLITLTARNAKLINNPLLGATDLSLSLAVSDSAKEPTVFSLANGQLQMQEGSAALLPLHAGEIVASGFIVANVGGSGTSGSIQVQFTLAKDGYAKTFYGSATLHKNE